MGLFSFKCLSLVNQYIERGGNIKHVRDHDNKSVLHHAVARKYLHIVSICLEHGVEPTIQDKYNNMPLDVAIDKGQDEIAALLVKKTRKETWVGKVWQEVRCGWCRSRITKCVGVEVG